MLNTDIFKFEFVDRMEERKAIDMYLSDFTLSPGYALWLHGCRGCGKSFFLTEHVLTRNDFTSIYVDFKINDSAPGAYLKEFISQLTKSAKLKFTSYLRANYASVATIGQKAVNVVLSIADLDEIGLDELGNSITNYYISKHGEKENSVTVVRKYIAEALKKCKKMVCIFDNFSLCDPTSLDVLSSVTHELLYDARFRFIICTTDEDIKNRLDIKSVLAEKIANQQILIKPFEQKQLFVRMLERTFDLDETNIKLLAQAFELCNGNPQQFKELLINLYASYGIAVNEGKAHFSASIFRQMLICKEISFDIDSLNSKHKGAKRILQIIAFWGAPISVRILFDFINYLVDIDPTSVLDKEARNALNALEELHILTRTFNDTIPLIQFMHDSLKIAVTEYFREDCALPFLHFSIHGYLMMHYSEKEGPYWSQYYTTLLAYHSYASRANEWIEINYAYGLSFFELKLFHEAESIFARLEPVAASLSTEQLLTIGMALFYCGQYHKADDFLSNAQLQGRLSTLSTRQAVQLHLVQARARLCMLDSDRALESISKAEALCAEERQLKVAVKGAKQSILFLTPGGFFKAKKIFDQLVKENEDFYEMAFVYQSAMDYYEGEESLSLLTKGLEIARDHRDRITEGKILNNLGFEFLRCGKYENAQKKFEESISILAQVQPHEQVYPYSNLSVLHMIFNEWEQALDDIVEALFWNRSEYASLVLKTNRMLCYYFTRNPQWEKIFEELYDYIYSEHNVDDKIYKKICINMALIASKSATGFGEAMKLLSLCRPHLENEWTQGKYRFLKLYKKVTGIQVTLPSLDPHYAKYYGDIDFEPWLVNFSHD